jgi:hypothetical protein
VYFTSRVVITDHDFIAYKWTGSDWRQLERRQAVNAVIDDRYVHATNLGNVIYRTKA